VAPDWNLKNGESSIGPTVAVEVTPIENWLELEAGVTTTFARHATEWDTDLLFKKPWTLSRKVGFMFGVGPAWVRTREHGTTTNSVAGEAVLDFMFWPSRNHRFGWYLEPGYDYNFGRGHEQSVGISGGLLIAIPYRALASEPGCEGRPIFAHAVQGAAFKNCCLRIGSYDGERRNHFFQRLSRVSPDAERAAHVPPLNTAPGARAWSSRRGAGALAADEDTRFGRLLADRVAHPHAGGRGGRRKGPPTSAA